MIMVRFAKCIVLTYSKKDPYKNSKNYCILGLFFAYNSSTTLLMALQLFSGVHVNILLFNIFFFNPANKGKKVPF